jgi:ABC-type transport system substrate-binding protein
LERVVASKRSLAGTRLEMVVGYHALASGKLKTLWGVKAVDAHTLQITTAEPYTPLPVVLASPSFGVVPRLALAKGPMFFEFPVGSGPLRVVSRTDKQMVLKPAPGRKLGLSSVDLALSATEAEAYKAYVAGDVDWSLVPAGQVASAVKDHGAKVVPYHAELFYGFNLADPVFAKRSFREAIIRAIDRHTLVSDNYDLALPLDGVLVRGVPGYRTNACGVSCEHSLAAARALVKKAYPSGKVPTVKIDFYEGPRERAVAKGIKADLAKVGIPASLRPRAAAAYDRFVVSGKQALFLFGWPGIAPTADSYLAPLFGSSSADNVTGFGSRVVDAALASARSFRTSSKQVAAYQKVEKAVLSTLPVVPLLQFETAYVVDDRVQGLVPRLDGTFDVEQVKVG